MSGRRRNSHFQCQQFTIEQSDCAMKVTTDASVFGAFVPVENAKTILDIGTGTGILSLFAAQRSLATIDAIEIEPNAAQQATLNTKNSPWPERINVITNDVRDYANQCPTRYDVIITNPPFFTESTQNPDTQKSLARHNAHFPLHDLLGVIQQLLATQGTAWILLPLEEANSCISRAANFDLTLKRHVLIRTSKQHSPHVAMIALEHQQIDNQNNAEVPTEIFTVYTRHPCLSDESAALFRDYYTKIKQA